MHFKFLSSLLSGTLKQSCVARRSLHAERNGYEVVVAGGGIMGCSSAYQLAKRVPPSSICVIERDRKYKRASTVLSVGSIRQQFSVPGNIRMSLHSVDFIKEIAQHLAIEGKEPPGVQFVEGGYLFLASEEGEQTMRENFEVQRKEGAAVELLSPTQLQRKFPWLSTKGVVLGCLGVRNEGWFDPWTLLMAFQKKMVSMGVHYLEGEVVDVTVESNRVSNIVVKTSAGQMKTISCRYLVNAAGPWASDIASMAGVGNPLHANPVMRVALPVRARKRCVFVFKCSNGPIADCPLVVTPEGAYFRREGSKGIFICGISPDEHEDKDGGDLDVDYYLFENRLWPILAERVVSFESLKLQSAWAGFYDYNTYDQNAIIGAHPVISNLIFVNGFSGHGIQQSPAAGVAVSELIVEGRTRTIDLRDFSFNRLINRQPLLEKNVV